MTEAERMDAGLIYDPGDAAMLAEQARRMEWLYDFNATRPSEGDKRTLLLRRMFAAVGEGCYIEPPLHANWAGMRVRLGNRFYANFNLTLVDDAEIVIGDAVMIGPNVTIATANHPILPALRERALQYNKPVHIGNNVWIGAGAIILPGVTIGDDSVIGAGSVVTRDIPAGVVAVGNPCRVMRPIGERDRTFFYREERIDWENLRFPQGGAKRWKRLKISGRALRSPSLTLLRIAPLERLGNPFLIVAATPTVAASCYRTEQENRNRAGRPCEEAGSVRTSRFAQDGSGGNPGVAFDRAEVGRSPTRPRVQPAGLRRGRSQRRALCPVMAEV